MVTITGNGCILITSLTVDHQRGIRIDRRDLCDLLAAKLTAGQTEIEAKRVRITIEELDD